MSILGGGVNRLNVNCKVILCPVLAKVQAEIEYVSFILKF